ncbi:uncharacterized protein BDR25DRAFT_94864 [Lindgomyces ingoldianus]|uniref:Uncharacterized protein n=1 Tax=Lindgomyces ingoldianus TaxID=673940 RepID=A0ACB6QF09_9PLEO|nr:uncharacterized protein BDR25DRAFT_94864 [Lindgomyces ingoldianus]KAF2464721.1 hypothetical protein BDR25DRAFT_94864 [Lindgomyces ingoldianus]
MERTPSPPRRLHTPPAPLHGAKFDIYEPYSPPRRSSRVAAQRTQDQHQPHSPLPRSAHEATPKWRSSPKNAAPHTSSQTFSPPCSPASPFTHRTPHATRRAHLNVGPVEPDSDHIAPTPSSRYLSTMEPHSMLPTPAKTPRKRALHSKEDLSSATRALFPGRPATVEEAMPTPRKSRKSRKNVFTLESFAEQMDEETDKIEVYTDSKERVPEIDHTPDNPFLSKKGKGKGKAKANGTTRTRDANTIEMEEAVAKGEGMIYMFRGRKVLRKYHDAPRPNADRASPEFSQDALRRRVGTEAHRPFTRSSIQPRRLFQEEIKVRDGEMGPDDVDEEAVTDIEVPIASPSQSKYGGRKGRKAEEIATPVKPKFKEDFVPTTPPSTVRPKHGKQVKPVKDEYAMEIDEEAETPHATADELETSPAANTRSKNPSPFDSWTRTKSVSRTRRAKKRGGEALESMDDKKIRTSH